MPYWYEGRRSAPPHTALKLVTPPTVEPLSLAEAKRHCRIVTDDDNADVVRWVSAARRQVEKDTSRSLLTQVWDLFLDEGPSTDWVTIPYPPLQSIVSVNATDTAGAESVWLSTNYIVDSASEPARIALTDTGSWPSSMRVFQPVRIRFTAGWTTPDVIPADLVAAVALLTGWYSENRQPGVFEQSYYDRLIAPYSIFSAA